MAVAAGVGGHFKAGMGETGGTLGTPPAPVSKCFNPSSQDPR